MSLILMIIGILTTMTIYLPALSSQSSSAIYSGMDIVFGIELTHLVPLGTGEIVFSFLGLLAYGLPFIASLWVYYYKKSYYMSSLMFITSFILLLLLPNVTQFTVTTYGGSTTFDVEWDMRFGLYLAIFLSAFGFMLSSYLHGKNIKDETNT